MTFITGDIHGYIDIHKLSSKEWPEGCNLNKNDYLIISGDFGLVWSDPAKKDEIFWLKWLSNKPWTTLVIDGNHENHDLLAKLEIVEKFGGLVGKITDSIFHLKRGYVYSIEGKKIFTFGGAESTDKESKILKSNGNFKIIKRIEGKDWWAGELPTEEEKNRAWKNLKKEDYKVDIIIGHTFPQRFIDKYEAILKISTGRINDPTSIFLEEITDVVKFDKFYGGHFHDDFEIDKYRLLFDNIVEI
jgi:DNA repair exonuclease SbcCD nuclease subunit